MFDGLISNNEENKKNCPPPWYAPDKKNIMNLGLKKRKEKEKNGLERAVSLCENSSKNSILQGDQI